MTLRLPLLALSALTSLLFVVYAASGRPEAAGAQSARPREPAATVAPARDSGAIQAVGTAAISGTVVGNDAGAAPIRRARVLLRNTEDNGSLVSVTDDEGRFVFRELPEGRYVITVSKAGYVNLPYGAESHRGQPLPIALEAGQVLSGLVARLTRGSVLTGRVLDAHGQPFAGAFLSLAERRIINGEPTMVRAPASGLSRTDDRGVFRIYGVAAGSYVLAVAPALAGSPNLTLTSNADVEWVNGPAGNGQPPRRSTAGYATVYYPGTTDAAAATVIDLGPGEERGGLDVTLTLVPTATVTGRITRADGAPVTTAQITAVRDGLEQNLSFVVAPFALGRGSVTPDGQFTVPGLQPGSYKIVARAPSVAPVRGGPPPARGGARLSPAEARALALGRRGGSPAPPAQAPAGDTMVAGPAVGPVQGAPVPPPPPPPPALPPGGIARGGVFISPTSAFDLWAETTVAVSGDDVEGLTLVLQPGMTVSGRLQFDSSGGTPPEDLSAVRVMLSPPPASGVSFGIPPVQAAADGTFTFDGVAPGAYLVSAGGPGIGTGAPGRAPAWMLRSATSGGRDVSDTPLEIRPGQNIADLAVTFTDRVTALSGRLLDGADRPAPEYYVLVFGTNPAHWRQGSRWLRVPTRPSTDGRFLLTGLPAGDYYLAALPEFDQNEWHTPAFLEQVVPGAIRITLGEGEQKLQDIRLAGG